MTYLNILFINAMTQIKIEITCDEGYVADSLREIAAAYEDNLDNEMNYESEHCYAEFSEDEE